MRGIFFRGGRPSPSTKECSGAREVYCEYAGKTKSSKVAYSTLDPNFDNFFVDIIVYESLQVVKLKVPFVPKDAS